MANTKNAKKAQRQAEKRRLDNKYHVKTTRTMIKELRATDKKDVAEKALPGVVAKIDKLVRKRIIHKNTASNLKSSIMKKVAKLK
jgi:small subunit ribosomal protein S20